MENLKSKNSSFFTENYLASNQIKAENRDAGLKNMLESLIPNDPESKVSDQILQTQFFKSQVADFNITGRGLKTVTTIYKDQVILKYPIQHCAISSKTILNDSMVKRFVCLDFSETSQEEVLDFSMYDLFVIFLIAHKRKGSKSKFYEYAVGGMLLWLDMIAEKF